MYLIDAKILRFYDLTDEYVVTKPLFKEGSYLYHWDNIRSLFPSNKELKFDYEHFQILKPVFKASLQTYRTFRQSSDLRSQIKWFIPELIDLENLEIFGRLLAITSSFEHEMGNLFHTLTQGKPVPHLLKDLLQYEGFIDIFGRFEIFLIRFLIGNPQTINLRNIMWHGFLYPSQIPEEYFATLVLLLANFSETLQKRKLKINHRSKIGMFRKIDFHHKFDPSTFDWSSKYLLQTHKPIWKEAIMLFENGKYYESSLLSLPQIELILRLIYRDLNKYDVSAKLDEYYITLDTIFEKLIPGKSENNRIFSSENTISRSTLELIFDLFIAPNGLRLRDKIGHGEVDKAAVDQTICEYLLFISSQLLKNEKFTYSSKYAKPCQVEKLLILQIDNHQKLINLNLSKVPRISRIESTVKIEIFNRSTSETEITKSLYNILENLDNVGTNLLESYSEKLQLLESRALRSRNRKTLQKMIEFLPEFLAFYGQLISFIDTIFAKRKMLVFEEISSNLKKVKQIVENFEKFSHKNCNEWANIVNLMNEFNKIL